MAIDRGGLQYDIRVRNQGSGPVRQFRQDLAETRKEFAALRREMERRPGASASKAAEGQEREAQAVEKTTRAVRRRRQEEQKLTRQQIARRDALKELDRESRKRERTEQKAIVSQRQQFRLQRIAATETRARLAAEERVNRVLDKRTIVQQVQQVLQARGISLTQREARSLGLLVQETDKAQKRTLRYRRDVDALRKARREASNERLKQLRAEAEALRKITQAQIRERTNQILAARGRSDLIPGARGRSDLIPGARGRAPIPDRTPSFFDRLTSSMKRTDREGNRISFTFRRLFGILAAFAAARYGISYFTEFVKSLVSANAALETTEIGLAAVLSAVAEVRDEYGNLAQGADALRIAQIEARKQTQQLRLDALATTATFAELAESFQTALAPGLQAGLNINEIRVFARQISQAATAIGLPQQQLAEEIRSLLSGTISQRNTRIARALGITNADIRRATEAGRLFEFLQERFETFNESGLAAAQTFSGLVARLRGGLEVLVQFGGLPLFEELKDFLGEALNSLIQINEEFGFVEPNPRLLFAVRQIAEGFQAAVVEARAFRDALTAGDLQQVTGLIGQSVAVLARLLRLVAQGVAGGLGDISRIFNGLGEVLEPLSSVSGEMEAVLVFVVRIATSLVGIGILVGGIVSSARVLGGVFLSILGTVRRIGVVLVGTKASGLATLTAGATALLGVMSALLAVFLSLRSGLNRDLGETKAINSLNSAVTEWLRNSSDALELVGVGRERVVEIQRYLTDLNEVFEEGAKSGEDYWDVAAEGPKRMLDELGKVVGDFARGITEQISLDTFDNSFQGLVLSASSALQEIESRIQQFEDERRRSQIELGVVSATTGLSGVSARAAEIATRSRLEANERLREVNREIGEAMALQQQIALRLEELRSDEAASTDQIREAEAKLEAFRQRAVSLERAKSEELRRQAELANLQILAAIRAERASRVREAAEARIGAAYEAQIRLAEFLGRETESAALHSRRAVDLLNSAIAQASLESGDNLVALNRQLADARRGLDEMLASGLSDAGAVATQQELITALEEELRLETEIGDAKIAALEAELEAEQRLLALRQSAIDQPIATGIFAAAAEDFANLTDPFIQTLDFMRTAIQGFSAFVTDSLIDAFDPTADGTIQERFGRFLQDLARQIIQTLVQIAVQAAILNALSGGILGSTLAGFANQALGRVPAGSGLHEGGRVRRSHRKMAASHATAPGFASGGGIFGRPSHLHPTDTVPAWLAPNEFVIRARSAARAGYDVLDAINRGDFDRLALRSALGLSHQARSVRGVDPLRGMASGGRVAASEPVQQDSGPPVALVVSNERTMRSLLDGGRSELIRFLEREGFRR